ncbi:MAG TPA: hypothetical protein PLC53_01265 [Bacilli bacterium]|nr:hypothetical protein [Bacilli bacterium]
MAINITYPKTNLELTEVLEALKSEGFNDELNGKPIFIMGNDVYNTRKWHISRAINYPLINYNKTTTPEKIELNSGNIELKGGIKLCSDLLYPSTIRGNITLSQSKELEQLKQKHLIYRIVYEVLENVGKEVELGDLMRLSEEEIRTLYPGLSDETINYLLSNTHEPLPFSINNAFDLVLMDCNNIDYRSFCYYVEDFLPFVSIPVYMFQSSKINYSDFRLNYKTYENMLGINRRVGIEYKSSPLRKLSFYSKESRDRDECSGSYITVISKPARTKKMHH